MPGPGSAPSGALQFRVCHSRERDACRTLHKALRTTSKVVLFRAQPRHLASASAAAPQIDCRLYAVSTLSFLHNARSRGRNAFPPHYAQVSETMLPAELYAGYTVVEYAPPAPPQAPPPTPPAFVFLLDLALESTKIDVGFERLPCKTLSCHTLRRRRPPSCSCWT